jgi:hypothetical protein
MAVLVEAISVIVRRDSIDLRFPGGWRDFESSIPNATLCTDEQIARVGFMTPKDVEKFINYLEDQGLIFLAQEKPVDLAVVDQQRGLTIPCDWLEFGKLPFRDTDEKVSMCWFFEGQRIYGNNVHYFQDSSMELSTPLNWEFEGSLSQRTTFIETSEVEKRLIFLRSEDGVDVYLDTQSGKEVYQGRNDD